VPPDQFNTRDRKPPVRHRVFAQNDSLLGSSWTALASSNNACTRGSREQICWKESSCLIETGSPVRTLTG
jgi:hypothetical protein